MMRSPSWLPVLAAASVLIAGCGGGATPALTEEELDRLRADPRMVRLDGILERADTLLVPSVYAHYSISYQGTTASDDLVERVHCNGASCTGDEDSEFAIEDLTDPLTGVELTSVELGSHSGFDTLIAGGRIDISEALSDVDPDITITSVPSARSYGFWGEYGAAALQIADGPLSFRFGADALTGTMRSASGFAAGEATGTSPAGLGSATWSGIAEAAAADTFERRRGTATVTIADLSLSSPRVGVEIDVPGFAIDSSAWSDIPLANGRYASGTPGHDYLAGDFHGPEPRGDLRHLRHGRPRRSVRRETKRIDGRPSRTSGGRPARTSPDVDRPGEHGGFPSRLGPAHPF